jgi:hypothetical protein
VRRESEFIMKAREWWLQGLGRLFLMLLPAGASGCLCFLHPVRSPGHQCLEACRAVPQDCRDHVHIVLINGLDPLYVGNMAGMRDYLQQLGFSHTYFGQLYDWWWFKYKVRRVHREDRDARFVVVGYSWGSSMAHSLARAVQDEGIQIDLLVHLDAVAFCRKFHHRPENVGRVLNVTSVSMLCGVPSEGAVNIHESDVWHFGPPTHPRTLEALAANLASLATAPKAPEAQSMPRAATVAPGPAPITTLPVTSHEADELPVLHLGER